MIALGATARTTGGEIFSFIAAGVLAAMAARGLTLGVRVGATGIVIRGMLRTRRVLWSELEKFSFGATGLFPAVGIARLVDGRQFAITAISTGPVARPQARAKAEAIIAELNQLLRERVPLA